MKTKKSFFIKSLLVLLLVVFTSGCTIGMPTTSKKKAASTPSTYKGGLYLTDEYSVQANTLKWQKIADVYTTGGKVQTLDTAGIINYALDPNDNAALYIGTDNQGIFYTYNYGQAWAQALTDKGAVRAIAVSPSPSTHKCTIFAGAKNYIYVSRDCTRTWTAVYYEPRANITITALAIRSDNPQIIYAGTSEGNFIRSLDGGVTWDSIYRFKNKIVNIFVQNQTDSKIIYVATQSNGIFRSPDGGDDPSKWTNLMETVVDQSETTETEFKEFGKINGSKNYLYLAVDKSISDGLIYANTLGIFRLKYGDIWRQLKLIPPKKKEIITTVAVNPKNTDEILYTSKGNTSGGIYRTFDGGVNWNITPLPNSGKPVFSLFSNDNKYFYLANYYYQTK